MVSKGLRRRAAAAAALLALAACSGPSFHTRGLIPPPAACNVNPLAIGEGDSLGEVDKGNGCHIPNPWRMRSIGGVALENGATLNCGMVGAVEDWLKDVVQSAAQESFGEPVTSVKVAASFSCRARNGAHYGQMSEHGFGNAIDISAFTLASGRTVQVASGWSGRSDERAFLRGVDQSSCIHFTTVLSPRADRHHRDHLHLDLMQRRSGQYCR
jgi:hypothetical protein